MPVPTQSKDNIYSNITDICKNVCIQSFGNRVDHNIIKHLRSKSYEILLKKSFHKYPDPPDINMALLKKCFIMKSNIKSVEDMERADRLEKCTCKVMHEKIYSKDVFQKVLSLLVCLADNLEYLEPLNLIPWTFGKRDELCLFKSKTDLGGSSIYPMYNIGTFLLNDDLDKEYFKDPFKRIQEAESRGQTVNPYLPSFSTNLLKLEPGFGLPLLGQFLSPVKSSTVNRKINNNYSGKFFALHENMVPTDTVCDMVDIRTNRSDSNTNTDHRVTFCKSAEGIVSEQSSSGRMTSARSLGSGSSGGVSIRTLTEQEEMLDHWANLKVYEKGSQHRNWMHLGNVNPPKEPVFATEADTALFFWSIAHPTVKFRKVDSLEFIQDLKHLLAGISSETFLYDESEESFKLVSNIVLPEKSPTSMEGYAENFIMAGNWMMHLTKLFCEHKQCNGFVYDALRKMINEYLFCYRQIVFNISCATIIEFYNQTYDLRTQIEILGHFFMEYSKDFPKGSQLLSMILSKANDVVNRDVELILFSIIRECCTVYFRIIQQWLFTGILYDPFCELFIIKNNVTEGSRLHWNTAYMIIEEDTPAFLKNISQEILICGKNLQLLRDCDPSHPLITHLPEVAPYIPCCLSLTEIEKLSKACTDYNTQATVMCGKMITIQVHLENERLKRIENYEIAQKKRQENYENWKVADMKLKQISKEKKDEQHRQLKQQIIDNNAIRENQRREQIREEIILIERDKIRVEQEKQRVEEVKTTIKAYYDELSNDIQAKTMRTEWKNKRRVNEEKRVNFLLNEREKNINLLMNLDKVIPNNCQSEILINTQKYNDSKNVRTEVDLENKKSTNSNIISEQPDNSEEHFVENNINEFNFNTKITDIENKINHMEMEANEELMVNIDENNVELYLNLNKKDSSGSDIEFSSALATPASDSNAIEDLNQNVEVHDNVLQNITQFHTKLDNQNDNVYITDRFNNLIEDFESAKRNKLKVLGISEQIDNYTYFNTHSSDNLSAAEVNKRHILGHHYNEETENNEPNKKTQAQINKEKYFAEEFGTGPRETKSLTLNLNADGLKNRERMFFSSLDYLSNPQDKSNIEEMKTSRSISHMSVDSTPMTPHSSKDILELPEKETLDTADILAIAEDHKDIQTADVDLLDGFKFPVPSNEYYLKEKGNNDKTNNLIISNYEMENPLKNCLAGLTNKQLHIFQGGKEQEDDLEAKTIQSLSIGNLTSFLQRSVQIPLMAQCDLVRDAVMHYFLSEVDILGHFYSLRRFLLLLDGEFGASLCGDIFSKMESGLMPAHVLSSSVLHDILNRALIICGGASDPNSERISFCLREAPPTRWEHSNADALKCLMPSYKAPWPLSMILPQSVLDQYSIIFQHLVKVRRVAFKLEECFELMNASLRSCGQDLLRSKQFRSVQLWRGVMSHFVRSLQVYQTGSVLHSATWKFEKLLQGVKGADELYRRHKQYVKHITFLCFQSESSIKVRKVFDNCFTSILLFNRTLKSGAWILRTHKPEYKHPRFKDLEKIFNNFEDIAAHCYKFCLKLSTCGYQPMLVEFVDLLDMNGYYSKLMEKYT